MKKGNNKSRRLANYKDRLQSLSVAPDMGAVYPITRGDIFFAKERDAVGHEIKKDRPCVIVSNDRVNAFGTVLQVVFLTSQTKRLGRSDTVGVRCQGQTDAALCSQVTAVDRSRLGNYAGRVSADELAAIDRAILAQFQLPCYADPDTERQFA